jgi:hypothetical protein
MCGRFALIGLRPLSKLLQVSLALTRKFLVDIALNYSEIGFAHHFEVGL